MNQTAEKVPLSTTTVAMVSGAWTTRHCSMPLTATMLLTLSQAFVCGQPMTSLLSVTLLANGETDKNSVFY